MAGRGPVQHSLEEVLDKAARLFAGIINAEKMGISPENVDVEGFINCFKEALSELLYHKDAVLLTIGEHVNGDFSGVYSHGMQFILKRIESQMQTKFYFYHGISIWVCKDQLYTVWLPQ